MRRVNVTPSDNYPTVLSVAIGFPATILGIIAFALTSDGDGHFNATELAIFVAVIVTLVALCIIDIVRWENWKEANR